MSSPRPDGRYAVELVGTVIVTKIDGWNSDHYTDLTEGDLDLLWGSMLPFDFGYCLTSVDYVSGARRG